ncbi:uncharacterized protein MONBRDRAFT_30484 [Monosiga brevicollis MX1]|uniref:Uncharacterized protein n=1 Tax=Monosiga brevicollis TaxID=81824 RepID=A9VE48_MONBE|nr:uncharacterized protein MONBRDRAFT_30484 [Monosiga brevicollis MX1]EDQ84200.1 predicted protein [Monosiga brevicollis MX1]|eukprot:XP_001750988.1 hypothetical protein [Monosiga brevicollis MX1]
MWPLGNLLILAALVALAIASGVTRPPAQNPPSLVVGSEVDKKHLLRKIAKMQTDFTGCFRVQASNTGLAFKTDFEGISFQPLNDTRGGYRAFECDDQGSKTCFTAFDCNDFEGRLRCLKIKPCQCLMGDYFTQASGGNGFKIMQETASQLTTAELNKGKRGLPGMFQVETCLLNNTFNLLPCNPLESRDRCEAFVPCDVDAGETGCQELMPSALLGL